jgi:hypothetical protein
MLPEWSVQEAAAIITEAAAIYVVSLFIVFLTDYKITKKHLIAIF